MKDIKDLRVEIDTIDKELVRLFEKRMDVVKHVAEYKIATNKPLKDPDREVALIEKNLTFLKNKAYSHYLKVFFKDIMESSRNYQSTLIDKVESDFVESYTGKVAFQGVEGSFSSIALTEFFGDKVSRIHTETFENVFKMVHEKEVDYGILPIENSSTGAINEVFDLLKAYQVKIVGEYYLKVRHHLIGLKDSTLENIQAIYSHEQGFKQSSEFLKDKDWTHFAYINTAKSVEHIKQLNDLSCAAIASEAAASVYDLKIIKRDIQNSDHNATRFVIISSDQKRHNRANKISLILSIAHEPQSLFKVLEKISEFHVNMLKIESRPIPDKPWAYSFYLDLEGNLEDGNIKKLMSEIKDVSHNIMILGNYYSTQGVQ